MKQYADGLPDQRWRLAARANAYRRCRSSDLGGAIRGFKKSMNDEEEKNAEQQPLEKQNAEQQAQAEDKPKEKQG